MLLFKNITKVNNTFLNQFEIFLLFVVLLSTSLFNTIQAKASEVICLENSAVLSVGYVVGSSALVEEEQTLKVNIFADTVAVPENTEDFVAWCKNKLIEKELLDKYKNRSIEMRFTVKPSGKLMDLVVVDREKGLVTELDKVFVNPPQWLPAIKNGKAVSSKASFDVSFLDDGESSFYVIERVKFSPDEKNGIRLDILSGTPSLQEKWGEALLSLDVLAEPPGGLLAFQKWVADNFEVTEAAKEAGFNGTIQVKFAIEVDGSLSSIRVLRDFGYGLGEAAVDLMKKAPKWLPAIRKGKLVKTFYTFPIRLDFSNLN